MPEESVELCLNVDMRVQTRVSFCGDQVVNSPWTASPRAVSPNIYSIRPRGNYSARPSPMPPEVLVGADR